MATTEAKVSARTGFRGKALVDYALIWGPLFLACVLFVLFMPGEQSPHRAVVHLSLADLESGSVLIKVDSVLHVSIIAVVFLVALGTLEFFFAVLDSRRDALTRIALGLTLFAFFGSGLWGFAMFVPATRQWLTTQHRTELLTLGVFVVFVIIDWLFWVSARRALAARAKMTTSSLEEQEIAEREKRELSLDRDFALKSLLLIDVPVLFGVTAVLLISKVAQEDTSLRLLTVDAVRLFPSAAQADALFDSFMRGFVTGSTTMHVAFSQFVFGVLKTFDRNARAKSA